MSKLNKVVLLFVGAIVALCLVVLIGRNFIIKSSVPSAARAVTGFDASVGGVDVGLFSSRIGIQDLKVTNPDDFADKRMLVAPEIHVEYRLASMFSHRREFPVIRIRVQEVALVKNQKGESNVARLMSAAPGSKGNGPGASNHFGLLELTVGKVTLVDYSKMVGGKPLTQEMTLNFHGTYHDVSDDDLKKIVMLPAIRAMAGRLADITPDSVEKGLENVAATGMGVATNLTERVSGSVKGLGGLLPSRNK